MGVFDFLQPKKVAVLPPLLTLTPATTLSNEMIVIDLETTGLDPSTCEITEIAAIKYHADIASIKCHGDSEIDCFHSYVKPVGKIPKDITRLTGISAITVFGAPALENIFPDFLEFISDHTLVGYNISFDIGFLQTRMQQKILNNTVDVLPIARQYIASKNYKLSTLKELLDLPYRSHSALNDCRSTFAVLSHCIPFMSKTQIGLINPFTILARYNPNRTMKDVVIDIIVNGVKMTTLSKDITRSDFDIEAGENTILLCARFREKIYSSKETVLQTLPEAKTAIIIVGLENNLQLNAYFPKEELKVLTSRDFNSN